MGLDSYFIKIKRMPDYPLDTLCKALLVINNWGECYKEDTVYFKNLMDSLQKDEAKIEEVGYFRKNFDLHKWIIKNCYNNIDDCLIHNEITQQSLLSYAKILVEKLLTHGIEPVEIVNSVKIKDEDLIVSKCDGIEYVTADNSLVRLLNGDEELYKISSLDGAEYSEIVSTLDTLIDILSNTDFETEAIVYLASW